MSAPPQARPWTPCILAWLAWASGSDAAVVINEIHYNSPGATDVEFIELYNDGTHLLGGGHDARRQARILDGAGRGVPYKSNLTDR